MAVRCTLLFLLCISLCISLSAQDRSTYRWYFGNQLGLDFNTSPPSVLNDGQATHAEGTSVASDPVTGELILYTDGNTVWNGKHRAIATNLHTEVFSSTHSAVIVQQPGSTDYYHIFTTAGFPNSSGGARHIVVDISANGGAGGVVSNQLLIDDWICEKIAVVRNCRGDRYWVMFHLLDTVEFRAYSLTEAGLGAQPVLSSGGNIPLTPIGEIVVSPNQQYIATASWDAGTVAVFDFDNARGIVSNPRVIPTKPDRSKPYGLCFSPNSQWLYVTNTAPSWIGRYDLNARFIDNSLQFLSQMQTSTGFGQLELAPDGKIYMSTYDGDYISTITDPDSPNAFFTQNAIRVPRKLFWGLPSFPYKAPITISWEMSRDTVACPDTYVRIGNPALKGYSYSWTPAALLDNPTIAQPLAHAVQTTTFMLRVSTVEGCTWIDSVTIRVGRPPVEITSVPSAVNDTVRLCEGDTATLSATTETLLYRWSTREGVKTIRVSKSGAYSIEVMDSTGCKNRDTIVVISGATLNAYAGVDTAVCTGTILQLSGSGGASYLWQALSNAPPLSNNDIPNPIVSSQQSGDFAYSLRVENGSGCYGYDTVHISVKPQATAYAGRDTTICAGTSLQLSGSGGSEYLWQELNNAPPLQKNNTAMPIFLSQQSGDFAYSLKVGSDSSCYGYDTLRISVKPQPIANAGRDTTICAGTALQLTASGGSQYHWMELNGAPALSNNNIATPIFSSQQSGVFEYALRVDDGTSCYSYDTLRLTVKTILSVKADGDSICAGEVAEVRVVGYEPTNEYTWVDEQGKVVGKGENIQVKPLLNTRYLLHGTHNGCEGWDTVTVRVNPLPTVQIASKAVLICEGESVELAIDNGQSGLKYEWREENSKVVGSGEKITVNPTQATRYIVQASTAAGCTAEDTAIVSITPKTRVQFSVQIDKADEVRATDSVTIRVKAWANRALHIDNLQYSVRAPATMLSIGGGQYQGDEVVVPQSGAIDVDITPKEIAVFRAMVLLTQERSGIVRIGDIQTSLPTSCRQIDSTLCTTALQTDEVCANPIRGIRLGGEVLLLFPNPATEEVSLSSEYAIDELRLSNAIGEELVHRSMLPAKGRDVLKLNMENYAAGLYFVRAHLAAANVWVTKSLMIVR